MLTEKEKDLSALMIITKNDEEYSKQLRGMTDKEVRVALKEFVETSRHGFEQSAIVLLNQIESAELTLANLREVARRNDNAIALMSELFPVEKV